MAELAVGAVAMVLQGINLAVVKPVRAQLNYLCCFATNLHSLESEAHDLDKIATELQEHSDRARECGEVVGAELELWLTKSRQIKEQTDSILNQVQNVGSSCLELRSRFSLSKRAKKTTLRIKVLRSEYKFDGVRKPRLPTARLPLSLGTTYAFDSRKELEEEIKNSLRGSNVNVIGIWGMGGLGKTTMVRRIVNALLEEKEFEEVAMTVVSQHVNKSKLLKEIGGALGLNRENTTSDNERENILRDRLSADRKTLIVLDDVWHEMVLDQFGIPSLSKGCKIILTSRSFGVLSDMKVDRIFRMDVLSEDDAWFLFKENVGTCVDDPDINPIAKDIVKECAGLPVALRTLGLTLRDRTYAFLWRDALLQLRRSTPHVPALISQVYNPLKLSYDLLESKPAQSLFLICSLFPEDASISVEHLAYFSFGLGILDDVRDLKETLDRTLYFVDMLKRRSLLLEGLSNPYPTLNAVNMHDVVRDVCIFIAKQEGYIGNEAFDRVEERHDYCAGFGVPTLRAVFLSSYHDPEVEEKLKFDAAFFEKIRHIQVLQIRGGYSIARVTHPTHSLTNLNTLVLMSCRGLKTVSVFGELVNLEILVCRDCHQMEELPDAIKGSNRLKVLDLSGCNKLQSIGRGIIASLVRLEELKMLNSFKRWEAENGEKRKNAALRELEALPNLKCLEIEINDTALIAENMQLSSKMDRFQITVTPSFSSFVWKKFNTMFLYLEEETSVGNWIEMQLLSRTEHLSLYGNGAHKIDLAKTQSIKILELAQCAAIKNISETSMECIGLSSLPELQEIWDGPLFLNSFQNLKELKLIDMAAMERFWRSTSLSRNNSGGAVIPHFTNLHSITILHCPRLLNLDELSMARGDCLPQLKGLRIEQCEMMERVFLWNEQVEIEGSSESQIRPTSKTFPKLSSVMLVSLPNLVTFYHGIESIDLPKLKNMTIEGCPKLKSFGPYHNQNLGGGGISSSRAITGKGKEKIDKEEGTEWRAAATPGSSRGAASGSGSGS